MQQSDKNHKNGLRVNPVYPAVEEILSGLAAVPLAIFSYRKLSRDISSVSGWGAALGVGALLWKTKGHLSLTRSAGVKVEKSVSILKPASELFAYWRKLENLPNVMKHLKSVTQDGAKSHWVAEAPLGMSVEWDAEIINEHNNELIAWQSLEGSEVDSAGSVRFRELPGSHGTEVSVTLKYDPPGGVLGDKFAKLFLKDAANEIEDDLMRFKQLMEAGEVASTEGQPSARMRSKSIL